MLKCASPLGEARKRDAIMPSRRLISTALHALRPGTQGTIARFYLSEWFDE